MAKVKTHLIIEVSPSCHIVISWAIVARNLHTVPNLEIVEALRLEVTFARQRQTRAHGCVCCM